jgi:hypothetical protein
MLRKLRVVRVERRSPIEAWSTGKSLQVSDMADIGRSFPIHAARR